MSANLKTVLVVDDKEWIRIAISLVLEEFGYSVRCAEDGHSALREIHLQNPDILVSDLTMPGMSGFELLINVRRLFPAIKVIAMSGSFTSREVPRGSSRMLSIRKAEVSAHSCRPSVPFPETTIEFLNHRQLRPRFSSHNES